MHLHASACMWAAAAAGAQFGATARTLSMSNTSWFVGCLMRMPERRAHKEHTRRVRHCPPQHRARVAAAV
jgi:uncharacterized membrane protein YhiD involved in acid resistance